jgi:hypothetical protein
MFTSIGGVGARVYAEVRLEEAVTGETTGS